MRPSGNKMLTKEKAKEIINSIILIKEKDSKFRIYFYGGEPLLNKEVLFFIVNKLFKIDNRKNYSFTINTNGILIDEKTSKEIAKRDIYVSLSLDGSEFDTKKRKDKNNKETFNKILRALTFLKENNVRFEISCTINEYNYNHLEDIVKFVSQLGIKGIGFNIQIDNKNKISENIIANH